MTMRGSPTAELGMDSDYDYRLPHHKSPSAGDESPTFPATANGHHDSHQNASNNSVDGQEALLDLAQLEELHQEAERMKALGNKHMAAQEYTRAYNAYSAALQLSPVGPSSHVFLSNRAAALLSLKRYSAAATDARRAVALAPTFGKAHARLGQALYFLKDYSGAVAAYEDAIQYEPDNQVTLTYLEKAKAKLAKQQEKAQRSARGEDVSVAEFSVQDTVVNSIATDPNASAAIVSGEFRSSKRNQVIANAIAGSHQRNMKYGTSPSSGFRQNHLSIMTEEEDPDFDEAINIQKRANRFLATKQYKQAIEEYTAALFLVPDDENLSPQLHLGRAHALNGSRRHSSARNDAKLAIRIKPSPEAYSTLAKSLFYLKDYEAAVEAFENTMKLLPHGEPLSEFDQAYLEKAQAAVVEEASQFSSGSSPRRKSPNKSSPVPKLPPPRFVPREQAINSTPNLPPMPKQWPQQSPRSPSALRCGPEREVLFFSESLGIKLNRGPDGIVRVLSVSKETPTSPVARKGSIGVGDVIREAAGVDIRRPITNIMWGDTVALIRLSPRPITVIVAAELSEVPQSVLEQRRLAEEEEQASYAAAQAKLGQMRLEEDVNYRPSPASGDEPVSESPAALAEAATTDEAQSEEVQLEEVEAPADSPDEDASKVDSSPNDDEQCGAEESVEINSDFVVVDEGAKATQQEELKDNEVEQEADVRPELNQYQNEHSESNVSLRDEEEQLLGADIIFPRTTSQLAFSGWDNLRWMAHAGARKIQHSLSVERLSAGGKKGLNLFGFGANSADEYLRRKLVVYEEPSLILLLRSPTGQDELRQLLDLPEGADLGKEGYSLESFLVVENAIEPLSSKLLLSPLTTPTSVTEEETDVSDFRRRSCFYLMTPSETIALSAISAKKGVSYTDSSAFLETTTAELAIGKALCRGHSQGQEDNLLDQSWKHQIILGTLHSYVVLGSHKLLEKAIATAMKRSKDNVIINESKCFLHTRLIDRVDDSGLTPLHHACFRRFNVAVALLVQHGARVDIRSNQLEMAPIHLAAQNLDHQSLSIILSANYPVKSNPNLVDSLGRTAMYIAAVDGFGAQVQRDPVSLGKCIMALEAWDGRMLSNPANSAGRWPQSALATQWRAEDLTEVLRHSAYRHPLPTQLLGQQTGISIGALYHYPLHSAIISLLREIQSFYDNEGGASLGPFGETQGNCVARTTVTLLWHGFEPNERLDVLNGYGNFAADFEEFLGFTPIQILACAGLEAENIKGRVNEELLSRIMKVLADVADSLVRNGARLSLEAPPTKRSVAMDTDSVASSHGSSTAFDGPVIDAYDRTSLKIDSNKELLKLLGGSERLNACKKGWMEAKSVPAPSTFSVPFEHESAYEEKSVSGGNSEKSCAICWGEFGSLMNRKHKCRISQRYVCDDCSSKRVSFEGNDIRLSDGQFLLVRADIARAEREGAQRIRDQEEAKVEKMKQAHDQARQKRVDEEAQRDSLFGGVMEKAARLVAGEDSVASKPAAANQQVAGLSESLGQTRNALLDRGEKLDSLGEKTSQMVDASADFAKMAKELRKQSEGGFFW